MKLQLLTAAAAAALMAVPSLAHADDDQGWYLRGNVGYGIITDTDLTGALQGDIEGEGNVAGSLGLGYDFANNWRVELDVAQLWNDMGAIGQHGNTTSDLRLTSGMLNAIYDFGDMGRWEPYVGAGVGLVRGSLNAAAHSSTRPWLTNAIPSAACPNWDTCDFNDSGAGFGWQLLAGVGYDITDNLTWDTQYRYLNASGLDFEGEGRTLNVPVGAGTFGPVNQITTEGQGIGAHSVMTGFRYRFGASAPKVEPTYYTCWDGSEVMDLSTCPVEPPKVVYTTCWDGSQVEEGTACPARPQVQCWDGSTVFDASSCPAQPATVTCWDGSLVYDRASCPVQSYEQQLCANEYRQEIIYYEFDKPQSAETREKIQRILDTDRYCAVSNINVVGHTDSSGAASYNMALSKRRAADVRRELIRQGVDAKTITSEGKGETQLFIDTGDGVKEALNRRTEVLIRLTNTGVVN